MVRMLVHTERKKLYAQACSPCMLSVATGYSRGQPAFDCAQYTCCLDAPLPVSHDGSTNCHDGQSNLVALIPGAILLHA